MTKIGDVMIYRNGSCMAYNKAATLVVVTKITPTGMIKVEKQAGDDHGPNVHEGFFKPIHNGASTYEAWGGYESIGWSKARVYTILGKAGQGEKAKVVEEIEARNAAAKKEADDKAAAQALVDRRTLNWGGCDQDSRIDGNLQGAAYVETDGTASKHIKVKTSAAWDEAAGQYRFSIKVFDISRKEKLIGILFEGTEEELAAQVGKK